MATHNVFILKMPDDCYFVEAWQNGREIFSAIHETFETAHEDAQYIAYIANLEIVDMT